MFFSENNRLSKPHFDWPLLVTSYLLALYGVLAITIANFNPSLGSDRSLQDLIMDANNGRLQLMWVVVSMVVVAIIMSINYNIIGRLWPVIQRHSGYSAATAGCSPCARHCAASGALRSSAATWANQARTAGSFTSG